MFRAYLSMSVLVFRLIFDENMFDVDFLIHNLADGTVLSDNESEAAPELSSKNREQRL